MTERVSAEEKLSAFRQRAAHDAWLTDLPNRRLSPERLQRGHAAGASRPGLPLARRDAHADIDGFKGA